jgi:hypothetical protein
LRKVIQTPSEEGCGEREAMTKIAIEQQARPTIIKHIWRYPNRKTRERRDVIRFSVKKGLQCKTKMKEKGAKSNLS